MPRRQRRDEGPAIFASNPYVVGDPGIRFYAGAPLRTNDGHNIGTLCLIDTKPRDFDESQIELLSDLAEMAMDELELRICGRTDGLTGALTRRTFKEEARRAVALALRHHDDLSCIVFDFDLFKSVNDTSGYTTGDLVLAKVVEACARELRSTDLIGRLGGDKFVVLLPNTSTAGAARTAEKLRTAIGALSIDVAPDPISVTASFGIASLNTGARDADALLEHADKAAREAKAAGRNRCVTWHLPDEEADKGRRRVLKGGKILLNDRYVDHRLHRPQPLRHRRGHRCQQRSRRSAQLRSADQGRPLPEVLRNRLTGREAPGSRFRLGEALS